MMNFHFPLSIKRAALSAVLLSTLHWTTACGVLVDDEARMERARQALAAQDYRTAVIDLKVVVQNQPDNAQARRLLGEASLAVGDVGAAEKELERAIALGVPMDAVRMPLARAKVRLRRGAAAVEVADPQAGATDQERLQLWLLRGQAFAQMGQLDDAIASFTAADELDIGGAGPQLSIAQAKIQAADFAGAEEVLNRLLERFPNHPGALTTMAVAALGQQQAARAERILVRLLEDQRPEGGQRANILSLLTESHLAQRDVEGAQASLDELAALELGREIQLTLFRARIALAREEYESAIQMLSTLGRGRQRGADVQFLLGAAYLGNGQLGLAEPYIQSALAAKPDDPQARQLMGTLRARQGLEVPMGPAPVEDAGSPAAGPEAAEQRAALVERYAQAQQADPAATAEVADQLEEFVQANPDDSQIRLLIAQQRLSEGRFAAARDHYEVVAERRPDDPALLNNLAYVYGELGDERALATARRANELLPNNFVILDTLGWILVGDGQHGEGLPLLEASYQQSGERPDIGYHLAVARARAGDAAGAGALAGELLARGGLPEDLRADIEALQGTL